jgi:hypothetical protein
MHYIGSITFEQIFVKHLAQASEKHANLFLHQLAKAKGHYLLHQNVVIMEHRPPQLPIPSHLFVQGRCIVCWSFQLSNDMQECPLLFICQDIGRNWFHVSAICHLL